MDTKKSNAIKITRDDKNCKKLRLIDLKSINKYKKFIKKHHNFNYNEKKGQSSSKSKITISDAKKCLEDIFDCLADNNLLDDKSIDCLLQLNDKIINGCSKENKSMDKKNADQ